MAIAPIVTPLVTTQSTWTFTQGFILGQASFVVIILVFVKYVVFSSGDEREGEEVGKRKRLEREKRAKLSTTGVPPPPPNHILSKTGYDMSSHPPESSDWLNVLMAQVLQGYRNDLLSDGGEEGARQRIERWLNPDGGKMSWLDPIQVTGLSLGTSYPLLSNARIRPADGHGRIRAEVDLDYFDSVSLSLSTSLLVNFPAPRFAVLPVSLGVELVSIGGTMTLQIHDPAGERQHVHVSLLPDFHLDLKTTTLLGSKAKLQDVPKLEQLIVSRLRGVIQDRLVHPNHLSLALPRLLSPSVSPTPIINDIGETAVKDVSEALRQGVSNVVQSGMKSLLVASNSLDSVTAVLDTPTPNPAIDQNVNNETSPIPPKIITEQYDGELEESPSKPISPKITQRRIPMPNEFARSTSGSIHGGFSQSHGHGYGSSISTQGAIGRAGSSSRSTAGSTIPQPSRISQAQPRPQLYNRAPSQAYSTTGSMSQAGVGPVTPGHSRVSSRQTVPSQQASPSSNLASSTSSLNNSHSTAGRVPSRPHSVSGASVRMSSYSAAHQQNGQHNLRQVDESDEVADLSDLDRRTGLNGSSRSMAGVAGGGAGYTTSSSAVGSQAGGRSAESASEFRFRGQFASQPSTPGVVDGRRVGVFNARQQ